MQRALGSVGRAFPGGEVTKGRAAQPPSDLTHPLWVAGASVACAALGLVGDRCGKGIFSAEKSLGYSGQTAVCCLRKPPKRKRGILPGVFASLPLMMNKGKRVEKRQPLMMEDCTAVRKAEGKADPK